MKPICLFPSLKIILDLNINLHLRLILQTSCFCLKTNYDCVGAISQPNALAEKIGECKKHSFYYFEGVSV